MNRIRKYICLASAVLALVSCREEVAPQIDQVWINMATFPIGEVECAYPKQTLCLYGSGFTGLQEVVVNGTPIDIGSTIVYDTDKNITFLLPEDVNVSDTPDNMYIRVITSSGECEYSPFFIKPVDMQPSVTSVSSTILVPGSVLVVKGKNLDGAREVYAPAAYGEKALCAFSEEGLSDAENLYVIVPEGVAFATGQMEIVMDKHDEACGFSYTEKVYSNVYDFIN